MKIWVRMLLILAVFGGPLSVSAKMPDAKSKLGKQVTSVSEKKFKREAWQGGKQLSPLGKKSFHMKEYDKHYSSLGSRKASSDFDKRFKRKEYDSPEVVSYERVPRKMSRWSGRQAKLKKESLIKTSQRDTVTRERQLYQAILQDTPQAYADMADKLSMKDINRFAFRRNHSKETPKATVAGQGTASR